MVLKDDDMMTYTVKIKRKIGERLDKEEGKRKG